MERIKAPGLKWIKRANGHVPTWVADEADVKNGYQPKTVNLSSVADQPDMLKARCDVLQSEMILWRTGYRRDPLAFDSTFQSLLSIYQRHPESPFHNLKPGSVHPYKFYIARLEGHIGKRRIDAVSGLDYQKWHRLWSKDGKHLAASAMARAVLDAAISFGIMNRLAGCADLATILVEAKKKIPSPRRRTQKMTSEQVTAARAAAHAAGRPSRALAYAIAFETTLRLWDTIGQWWPMDGVGVSDVIDAGRQKKWFGLRWEDIDADLVLTFTPSKTSRTTEAKVTYSLTKAPMVLEELAHWPAVKRRGPVIVAEATGLPYRDDRFADGWRSDRKKAGIDASVWARDLRASGITEGRASDVSLDDASKVAGHRSTRTTARYDRAVLEAADRFADARVRGRKQSGNDSGNGR